MVALHGGDLFADGAVLWDFVQVVLRPPASFVAEEGTEDLKLSAGKSTGTITGQFRDIVTGLKAPIKGVVLQQQRIARGFFISTNSAGSFSMDRR